MDSTPPSAELSQVVAYLTENASHSELSFLARRYPRSSVLETWDELCILKRLLCSRHPTPFLPPDILTAINTILLHERAQKVLTSSLDILPLLPNPTDPESVTNTRISLWKGDITTLTHTTAIVNAANSQLLGCFVPHHRCIDNAIHAAAGPGLREECFTLMAAQGGEEPVGRAKVTRAYCLPAEYVIHTVGPQVTRGESPNEGAVRGLRSCYVSCLEALEALPAFQDGRKVLVFCCISTGIFGFPAQLAAENAVVTVKEWLAIHQESTITDVIFNVFTETDHDIYTSLLSPRLPSQDLAAAVLPPTSIDPNTSLSLASTWLRRASRLLITAGAGLSASTGLDYTSTSLFSSRFPVFTLPPYNFTRLYDLFGPFSWPSENARWGYYFHHLLMIREWPTSLVYQNLLAISHSFSEGRVHVRTSNADGFFVKNGFDASLLSTPQGQYAYLQCSIPCRASATFPTAPFLDAAIPFLDPATQMLTDSTKIPLCRYCGGKLIICVRSGAAFIEDGFAGQESVYRSFRHQILHSSHATQGGNDDDSEDEELTVILELGVGLSTPGVLRWPDEDLVARGGGKVKLVRIGLDAGGCVDWEDGDMAGIQGDVGKALEVLSRVRR